MTADKRFENLQNSRSMFDIAYKKKNPLHQVAQGVDAY